MNDYGRGKMMAGNRSDFLNRLNIDLTYRISLLCDKKPIPEFDLCIVSKFENNYVLNTIEDCIQIDNFFTLENMGGDSVLCGKNCIVSDNAINMIINNYIVSMNKNDFIYGINFSDNNLLIIILMAKETDFKANRIFFSLWHAKYLVKRFLSYVAQKRAETELLDEEVKVKENNDIHWNHSIIDLLMLFTESRNIPNFNVLNSISGSRYENMDCFGKIAFINGNNSIKEAVYLDSPLPINTYTIKAVRKFLEMTDKDIVLIADKNEYGNIIGIGKVYGHVDTIEFLGHMQWTLYLDSKPKFQYIQGRYIIPIDENKSLDFKNTIASTFTHISSADVNKLFEIIRFASVQKHGTMVVITEKAAVEAERLCHSKRGTAVTPFDLYEKRSYIKCVSSIDGAIIIDERGICYGVGVILDGVADGVGEQSRGARYNSALSYINWQNKCGDNCLAAVISEDGDINIIATNSKTVVVVQ